MAPVRGQLGFFVDTTRCVNCKTCEIACKDFHDNSIGRRFRRVRTVEGGDYPNVFAFNISMSCNHCEDPECVRQCPAQAYSKRVGDGIVVHDPERCIGCRYCTWVCPYGAPQYDEREGHVRKCDFCVDELAQGREPVCVTSCPLRAIAFGPLENIAAQLGATDSLPGFPDPGLTRPSCRYKLRAEASVE